MLEFITEKVTCWEKLQKENKPIYIYGMGDGAMKIMSVFKKYGIKTVFQLFLRQIRQSIPAVL